MSKQKKKESAVSAKIDVKKKKKRKSVLGYVQKSPDRVKSLLTCPDSALTEINIKTFVNEETLQRLPSYLRYKLITLLPKCDQIINSDESLTLSDEAFTNEFFTKACEEWRNKLAEGCFTDDRLQHMNIERSRQQASDAWKIKYFENAVPPEHLLKNCSQSSPSTSTTSRKRKLDDDSNDGSCNAKKFKTKKINGKNNNNNNSNNNNNNNGNHGDDEDEETADEEESAGARCKRRKNIGINKRKMATVKKSIKASGIKKTKLLKNKAIKANKRLSQEPGEFKKCLETSTPDKSSEEEIQRKHCYGQLIKSKILSHLNNKLVKCKKQQSNSLPQEVDNATSDCQQQEQSRSTLTLSDLISREFELVCNGSAKETASSTLKFENLKIGFVSRKMFQLDASSTSLPHLWKLPHSSNDLKLGTTLESDILDHQQSNIVASPPSSNTSKDFKNVRSDSSATATGRPLSEYFPLLSNSLKNTGKPIEPTTAQLKLMSSKSRTQNSVERETLLCLANKLSQKLFGKLNFAKPCSPEKNPSSVSKTSELPKIGSPSTESLQALSSEINPSLPKQMILNTNFNLLKNILLSISNKSSSLPNSSQTLKPLSSISTSDCIPSSAVSSKIACLGVFPQSSIRAPEILASSMVTNVGNASNGNFNIIGSTSNSSPPISGSLVSSLADLNAIASLLSLPTTLPQLSSILPFPVLQSNFWEQQKNCLNMSDDHLNNISRGTILRASVPANQNVIRPTISLQMRALAQRPQEVTRTSVQSPIQSNTSLQQVCLISSKVHPSVFTSSSLQTQPNSSNSSNVDHTLNDTLLRNLIFTDGMSDRKPQNIPGRASQLPLVQEDRLINFQLNSPSSNLFISTSNCNNNNYNIANRDDNVKIGNTSFQIPMTSLLSTLRLQGSVPLPHGNQIASFQAPNNSVIAGSNGSSPLIILSPVNQQLNLGSYLTVNNIPTDNSLTRPAFKKPELSPNNILQLNQVLMPSQSYLPMLNLPQGPVLPQMSPTMSKNQIVLLQNSQSAIPSSSKTFTMPQDPNGGLKNVTIIPMVNSSASTNQMFLLLSPAATNQK